RMVAERPPRIGAEAASARPLGALLGNERHRSIETDSEHVFRRFEIGVCLAVLNIGSEPANAGADRLAILGMAAHFARQRKQSERALQIDLIRRGSFRQPSAARFLAIDRFAKLQIGAEATAAQRHFEARLWILAEDLGADIGRTIGRDRERPRVAAFRITGAADKSAELAQLE